MNQLDRLELANYPLRHKIRARFRDVDSLGHLNNVAIASYYEDARAELNLALFGNASLTADGKFQFVLAQVTIQYLRRAAVRGEFTIGTGIGRVGNSSVRYVAAMFQDDGCVGLCDAVMVHVVDGRAEPLPSDRRAALNGMGFPG